MDYLSSLIEEAQRKNLIRGFEINQRNQYISHLLFADDILLFLKASVEHLKNLNFIVKSFEQASGLKVNLHKSCIAGVNVDDDLMQQAEDI